MVGSDRNGSVHKPRGYPVNLISNRLKVLTFRLGHLYLGIDVRDVQEVLVSPIITPVPHAHESVKGLINLRGQIATCIDARRRFDIPVPVDDEGTVHIVVSLLGEWLSLVVDRVAGVVRIEPEDLGACPDTLPVRFQSLILGSCPVDDELLLVVDLTAAVTLHYREAKAWSLTPTSTGTSGVSQK